MREHLRLAQLATKRDHADPATVDALVHAVDGKTEVLSLLRFLTEADARAAGPAAWSPWRAQLINALADQVEGMLVDDEHRAETTQLVDLGLARSVELDGRPRIRTEPKPGGCSWSLRPGIDWACSAMPLVCLPRTVQVRSLCCTRWKAWP